MGAPPYLIARIEGRLGHLTLDRPERINALGPEMIDGISTILDSWAQDPAVELVLLDGAGSRGLCAGGDIKEAYQALMAGQPAAYWADEYRMDARVAHFPKPYVAFMDGITMGGGIGVSGHGSVRIVTERSKIAMPETAIGLVPDVGALYLLARAPGELGTHAALTGARLDAAQAIHAGLADHLLPAAALSAVAESLRGGVVALEAVPAVEPALVEHDWIDECYQGDDVQEIVARLENHDHPDALRAAGTIRAMSPTAVVATLRAIRNAATMTVDEVLDQDLRVCSRLMVQPDFAEGVRAQVIDKDRNPRWQPGDLNRVDLDLVDRLFEPLATH